MANTNPGPKPAPDDRPAAQDGPRPNPDFPASQSGRWPVHDDPPMAQKRLREQRPYSETWRR
jgi:hypothetical protein